MEKIRQKVELKTVENVKNFVDMISKIRVDADLASPDHRHIVDAKSILGVFSLNVTQPLELIIFDDESNAEKYQEIFDRFGCGE